MGNIYTAALMEHNAHPDYKYDLENATDEHEGVNPSCGDHLWLKLKVEDGVIRDGAFVGEGCAISQASADIMLDLVIGKETEEALELAKRFFGMIQGTATEMDLEELEDAAALQDVAHMPARVKCAVLGWRTLEEGVG